MTLVLLICTDMECGSQERTRVWEGEASWSKTEVGKDALKREGGLGTWARAAVLVGQA